MELQKTDPEFTERFRHFALEEVVNEENQQLDAPTRYLAILATLIGCGGRGCLPGNTARCAGKQRYANHGQGNRLSGNGLSRLWADSSLSECDK